MKDSFGARSILKVGGRAYDLFRLDALEKRGFSVARLPYSFKVLLENLLRGEDGVAVSADDVEALAGWDPKKTVEREIAFMPARVVLQDFTGVPAVVDLAAMRDAMAKLGGDPKKVNPLLPVELVIDHSVQVDAFASPSAFDENRALDYQRNHERYAFLRWGQRAFDNFKVVPPLTGIVHQVNLEHLARVVFTSDENLAAEKGARPLAYPDSVVGTDSHTPMVNGLGVLGWGVGGIEAEAAMLGQPIAMLIPDVLGVHLTGELREGATATDLVLHVAELLRKVGVVGKIVEFYGPGVPSLTVADRATIGNMTPEYGATATMFPIDDQTLSFLRFTGRSDERVKLVEAYAKEQGLFHTKSSPEPVFTSTVELDLSKIEPSMAGPKRPQDRVPLSSAKKSFVSALPSLKQQGAQAVSPQGEALGDGSVVIAAITSCTNTSNPSVMLAAGLLAKKAVEKGLVRKPWVKTSLAPGSQVVMRYYEAAGLIEPLEKLGFHLVGYGCTTCIGNSGPLPEEVSRAIEKDKLVVASVLSGNRNFEGRIHPEVRANYLMSPPLVVAYALVGRMDVDLTTEPLGTGKDGQPVFLKDIWPTSKEIEDAVRSSLKREMFEDVYRDVYQGDEKWRSLPVPEGDRYAWDDASTYVRHPPYFEGMSKEAPKTVEDIRGARALAVLGDSVTTDHISPAGSIKKDSPAGKHLIERGVKVVDFNSYGARRGNHEVMVRGTFANVRLKNELAPGTEGNATTYLPTGEVTTIYDAAMRYQADGTPLCILAGKEYGSGSSRDWAAKGPNLQGVRFVVAESYERIHRSNLVGMGILPLQFKGGESRRSLGLTGRETFSIEGLKEGVEKGFAGGRTVKVKAAREDGSEVAFDAVVRIDTPQEVLYYRHGGILQYVLRQLLGDKRPGAAGPISHGGGGQGSDDHNGASVDDESADSFPASDPPAH